MHHTKTLRSDIAPPRRSLRRCLVGVLLILGLGTLPAGQVQAQPFDICASGCRFSTIQRVLQNSMSKR